MSQTETESWSWDQAMQLLADGYSVQQVSRRTGFEVDILIRRARIRKINVRNDHE